MCLLLLMAILGGPDSTIVADPTAAFARRAASTTRPEKCVLVRLTADFTGDGAPDLALSATCDFGDCPGWGNAGGRWEIWAREGDEEVAYRFVDRVFFHPLAVKVTPSDSGVTLTTYHRMGAGEGYLVRDLLAGTSLRRLEESYVALGPDSSGAWFHEVFPVSGRLPCQACRLSDFLAGRPEWVPGYSVPSVSD
ncbi:MAG: hypothetical protein MUE60_02115 [Candidatus Eisenbacteria bacterium]|nr:hypothetical protein [Candidatus Eisenbacteria bacterium]